MLTFWAARANLDQLDAIFLIFYMECQALPGIRGKKLIQTAPNTSKRLEIGVRFIIQYKMVQCLRNVMGYTEVYRHL